MEGYVFLLFFIQIRKYLHGARAVWRPLEKKGSRLQSWEIKGRGGKSPGEEGSLEGSWDTLSFEPGALGTVGTANISTCLALCYCVTSQCPHCQLFMGMKYYQVLFCCILFSSPLLPNLILNAILRKGKHVILSELSLMLTYLWEIRSLETEVAWCHFKIVLHLTFLF